MARRKRPPGWLSRREYAVKLRCDQWGVAYTRVSRAAVFKRDGWRCQLCGYPVDKAKRFPNPWSASLDHKIPLSWGPDLSPGHVYTNCQLAHLHCNSSKGARDVDAPYRSARTGESG